MIDDKRALEITNKYYNKIRAHCIFLVGDEFEADDIVQNAFLLFEYKRETLEDEYVKAWLYKVIDLMVKEYFRKRQKEADRILPYTEYHGMIANIMESINREMIDTPEETDRKIEIIMNSLSETERAIFSMYKNENKSYKEIGEELGLSTKNVNVTAHRTRKKIIKEAKNLSPQWVMLLIKIYFWKFFKKI